MSNFYFSDTDQGLETILRIRPNSDEGSFMTQESENEVIIKNPNKSTAEKYTFDKVMQQNSSQRQESKNSFEEK